MPKYLKQKLVFKNISFKKSLFLYKGFSIVEMLVVLSIFSVLAILATQSIILTLKGSRKSESIVEVKENVEVAMSTMERLLRNSKSISCSGNNLQLTYVDEYNQPGSFVCSGGADGYIASGSALIRITSSELAKIDCTGTVSVFVCTSNIDIPDSLDITVRATHAKNQAAESATVESKSKILLRSY